MIGRNLSENVGQNFWVLLQELFPKTLIHKKAEVTSELIANKIVE